MTTADRKALCPSAQEDYIGHIKSIVSGADTSPAALAEMTFEEAVELLSQADISTSLSDDQEIDLVGFLLSNCART